MSTFLIVAGVLYLVTLILVVLPLCFGVILNTWREVLRIEKDRDYAVF